MLKKSSALVIAIAIAGGPVALATVPAAASTSPSPLSSIPVLSEDEVDVPAMPAAQHEDGEREDDEHEDGEHEDGEHEDHHGVIPPVVIKHHDDDEDDDDYESGGSQFVPGPGVTPAPGVSPGPLGSGATLRGGRYEVAPIDPSMVPPAGINGQSSKHAQQIDPRKVPAVDVAGIQPSPKTPADIFMESATIGLTAMGVGAIALGGFAGVRAIRLRKNPLGDYFYEADKKE